MPDVRQFTMAGRSVITPNLLRRGIFSCELLALKKPGLSGSIWHGACLSGWQ
jgi:hypothetical protein